MPLFQNYGFPKKIEFIKLKTKCSKIKHNIYIKPIRYKLNKIKETFKYKTTHLKMLVLMEMQLLQDKNKKKYN
jgi:hypothetical protein